jgi:hypothetical protein
MIGYTSKIQIENSYGDVIQEIPVGQNWQIRVFFKINKKAQHFIIGLGINSFIDVNISTSWSTKTDLDEGYYEAVFKETHLILAPGNYNLTVGLSNFERSVHYLENVASFVISEATDTFIDSSIVRTTNVGFLLNPMQVEISSL